MEILSSTLLKIS
jgi:hypothetical protein